MHINDHTKSNEDINKFIRFMKSKMIKKENKDKQVVTHTLMGPLHIEFAPFKGAFHIDGIDYDILMKLYKKIVGTIPIHIVERSKQVGPMVIDIDFKVDKKHKERMYGDDHIEKIIDIYNDLFRKYLNIDRKYIKAFVTEKPSPTYDEKNKVYKDGFHIIYPEIPLDVKKRYFFFDKAKREIMSQKIFSDIPIINSYDEILDVSVVDRNGMLLYGSCKEGREPYQLTKIYNHDLTIDSLDNYCDYDDLISMLSIRRYCVDDDIEMFDKTKKNTFYREDNYDKDSSESESDNDVDDIDDQSNDHSDESIDSKSDDIDKIYDKYTGKSKKDKPIKKDPKSKNYVDDSSEIDDDKMQEALKQVEFDFKMEYDRASNIKLAKALTKILSKNRAKKYDDWIRVGWALHGVDKSLLPTFIEFSKRCSSKYEDGCCEKVWASANNKKAGFTISSLHWWARLDDLDGYLKVMRERIKNLVFQAESGTHDDIANVVREMYKYIYRCVNISKNIWYEFQENKWVCVDSAYTLAERISYELTKEFFALHAYYMKEASTRESLDQDATIGKSKKIQRIYEKLKTAGFIKSVIECCARKFYDKNFEESLNTNHHLIGFENGVYDLKNHVFRRGSPDDLVSMSVGYDYINYNENDPEIKTVEKYFKQVQVDEDMREYILRLISSFLDGKVADQQFVLWTGTGCHAKDEKIMMYDGSVKNIQDIKLGDYVMGSHGRRKVVVLYNGRSNMYKINAHDIDKTSFVVNHNHRLAVRSHYQTQLYETYDDVSEKTIYWVSYHYNMEGGIVKIDRKYYDRIDAERFYKSLEDIPNVIQYGEILPLSVDKVLSMNNELLQYYRLVRPNSNLYADVTFDVVHVGEDDFYGIELDGNKQYVMANGYLTYNSNGKSTTVDLIHNTFGEYSGILPVTVLTRKRGASSGPIPELADKRGKRFLAIQEPEHDDKVYVGQMKELSAGNDKIYARAMYGDPFYYKPQFKLVLTCNKLPDIPSGDGGTWRRLRVTPWESKFVNGEPNGPLEFKKDRDLQEKMEEWGPPFIWILLNKYYRKYLDGGLREPEKVLKHTSKYKETNDIYAEWMKQDITRTNDENDSEKMMYIYGMFKEWFKGNYPGTNVPPQKELVKYFESVGVHVNERNTMVFGLKVAIDNDVNDEK